MLDDLRNQANELGFSLFGVTSAEPLPEDRERLQEWIVRGEAAGVEFMARDTGKRADPGSLLDGARSVIMLGMSCAQPPKAGENREGRLARFARGCDYHQVILPRLEALSQWLREHAGSCSIARSRCFVDGSPILERALAHRAGLGFIGKNNCLIHPKSGSWFLLGGIVTTLEVPPNEKPMESLCGSCHRCIDACPTGALYDAHRLDAGKCLSCWTIEQRDAMPEAIMEAMGDRLFGCDACQEACPHNEHAAASSVRDLMPPERGSGVELQSILAMQSNREFQATLEGRGLLRARLQGLQRNAAIVAGNLGRRDLEGRLLALAEDETRKESLRDAARWALGKLKKTLG